MVQTIYLTFKVCTVWELLSTRVEHDISQYHAQIRALNLTYSRFTEYNNSVFEDANDEVTSRETFNCNMMLQITFKFWFAQTGYCMEMEKHIPGKVNQHYYYQIRWAKTQSPQKGVLRPEAMTVNHNQPF